MKLYTSYFGNLKNIPEDLVPISICGKAPEWYKGLQYKKLAPKYDFFMKWKENHDNEYYIKCFNEQVLNNLNVISVCTELVELSGIAEKDSKYTGIVLLCYERPEDFCHRHLVADWFEKSFVRCTEL